MILVAGGAGYIGSHVNKLLNQRGLQTVVYDNLCYGHREFVRWGDFVEGDLADLRQLRQCFDRYPIEGVMHFCSFAYVGESVTDPARYYQNNVANTLNLLSVMREFGVNLFVFSSSCAVYGIPSAIPLTENCALDPISPYGRTKLMVERSLKDFDAAYGLRSASLRYFNAAGASPDGDIGEWHQPETHLIPLVLDVASGRRPTIQIYGNDYDTPDGTCVRDYIHVDDLASAHLAAFEYLSHGGPSDAFNLGNGQGFSVQQVIDVARKVTGRKIATEKAPRRPGDPAMLVSCAEKARRVLSWAPRHEDLAGIVDSAWRWHQNNQHDR